MLKGCVRDGQALFDDYQERTTMPGGPDERTLPLLVPQQAQESELVVIQEDTREEAMTPDQCSCGYRPRMEDVNHIPDYDVWHVRCYQCGREWVE